MIKKSKILKTLNKLPDEFSLDDLFEQLLIVQKVEQAQESSKKGLKYSEEVARKKIKKWSE